MNAWPVIARELRAEARRPANYWLRVIGAGLAFLIVLAALGGMTWGPGVSGRQLFVMLHWTLFTSICLAAPLLTAECISRERREGTLGLLFLTPLSPGGIMAGKSVVHALRALMLVLVALPVMGIAFVLGGVTRLDLIGSLGINLSALCLALAAGLVATVCARERVRALLLAEVLAIGLVLVFGQTALRVAGVVGRAVVPPPPAPAAGAGFMAPVPGMAILPGTPWVTLPNGTRVPAAGVVVLPNGGLGRIGMMNGAGWPLTQVARPGVWSRLRSLAQGEELFPGLALANAPPGARELWVLMLLAATLAAAVILRMAIWLGGLHLRRLRQEEPPSPRQRWLQRTFCTPTLMVEGFRRRMAGSLDRNPVGWLQHYSWSARLTKWGWCALIALTYSVNSFDYFLQKQPFVLGALAASIAFVAANSFRRERQSGALELLLVTPLTEHQIVRGRLRGIWWQFLPAVVVWWAGYQAIVPLTNHWFHPGPARVPYHQMVVMMWLTLPVTGLYASLRWRNLFTAWLVTLLAGFALPWILFVVLQPHQALHRPHDFTPFFMAQAAVAWTSYQAMVARLRSREFMS